MDQLAINYGVGNAQLPATEDDYGGVVVEMKEHMDPDVFRTLLKTLMSQWKLQGKKGVWIKLPIALVNLVETVVKEGFLYHHAESKCLMLVHWLPETMNTLPGNATHLARVGAIVLNDKQEILVVQEKLGGLKGVWKISTGILKEGEDISVGVVREVKEETGIDTEFVEVRAFSQEHDVFFGKSEVLFLCMMRPLSFDIQIQETEIEAAKWMPLEEYEAQTCPQEQALRQYITKLAKDIYWRRSFLKWKTPYLQHFQVPLWIEETSDSDATPIHCGDPCQPLYGTPPPPSPPSEPVYKSPPPPSPSPSPPPPVYKSPPPPPVLPLCPPPPPPQPPMSTSPVYGVPPPPPPMATSPEYGVPPSPPSIQGGCPPMQNCVYPSPNTNIYQPTSFASHLHIYFLHYLVLMFLLFLPF